MSCGNLGKASGGRVIRDCHGDWVKGFSRSIGHTTSVMAEWWALHDGLNLAIQLGISQLEIKLDDKVIVENRRCSKIQTVLIEVLLLYCVIAGVSWPGSGRFGWDMCYRGE